MKLLYSLLRKLFLVKEIISKTGMIVFRRYRLLQTPWFAIYIHQLLESDQDRDMHDHPWNFKSIILSGAYREVCSLSPKFDTLSSKAYFAGDVIEHKAEDIHQLTLLSPHVWTLFITSGREREWGYRFMVDGQSVWIDHKTYRVMKNEGRLSSARLIK